MPDHQRYRSYLLRIWRSGADEDPRWLASLEDVRTGERRGFRTLAQAFAFLEELTQAGSAEPNPLGRWDEDAR